MADGYGPRTPGQVASLAGAAGLVALLMLGGGWLVWRGLATTAHRPPPPSSSADLTTTAALPELTGGVAWGWPLTREGAAAAAATAVAVTGQPEVVFDPARFAEVAAVVFAPPEADRQARQVEAARTRFDASGWAAQPPGRRLYFFTPLAVRLTAFDPARQTARVEVWALTLVGVGDAGGAVFTTSTVDLAARDDRWTVTALDSVEGPTPLVADVASAPGRTRALLRDALPVLPVPVGAWP